MQRKTIQIIIGALITIAVLGYFGYFLFFANKSSESFVAPNQVLAAQFDYLSQHGNSSCSAAFKDSITTMQDDARLQGSCCNPMNLHRYTEQTEGLKKYKEISIIPPDPYNIEAKLTKILLSHYDDTLTQEQQKEYDYAMQNSKEKGPCCCKCWRWYVYGGLAKVLIKDYHFNGQQITEIWNLSDGCGGPGDHVNH